MMRNKAGLETADMLEGILAAAGGRRSQRCKPIWPADSLVKSAHDWTRNPDYHSHPVRDLRGGLSRHRRSSRDAARRGVAGSERMDRFRRGLGAAGPFQRDGWSPASFVDRSVMQERSRRPRL